MNDESKNICQEDIKAFLKYFSIPILPDDTNYWFLRTDSGQKFEDFFQGDYIGISWDSPKLNNIDDLKKAKKDELKKIISELYPNESRPGLAASTIQKFIVDMKPNDFVLIPNENSQYIAFGQIIGEPYIYEPTEQDKLFAFLDDPDNNSTCPDFLKRRDVKWIGKARKRSNIDPIIVNLIYSHNTLVNANPYKNYINRTLFDAYYQNGLFHGTFNIKKQGNIPALDLVEFIHTVTEQSSEIAKLACLEQKKDELDLKLTLNSPGVVEFITGHIPNILTVCVVILAITGGKIDFKGFKIKFPGIANVFADFCEKRQQQKFAKDDHLLELEDKKLSLLRKKLNIKNSQQYKNIILPNCEDVQTIEIQQDE